MNLRYITILLLYISVSPVLISAEECAVPCDLIVSGGPPPDGIPSIDAPKFLSVSKADETLDDKDLIIGIVINGEARAYPYEILNWHEIVNDVFDGVRVSITYCPLTASGIAFGMEQVGEDNTFGTSGKLYENNLVMYDRNTGTYYSQMLKEGIKGDNIYTDLVVKNTIETTWKGWKAMYPDSLVLSRDTGYSRSYDDYPYGSYKSDESIRFTTSYSSLGDVAEFYHPKTVTKVLKFDGITHLISFNELLLDPAFEVEDKIIFHDTSVKMASVFDTSFNGVSLIFSTYTESKKSGDFGLQAFEDQFGNIWNMKGVAIDGPDVGGQLTAVDSYNALWFAAISLFQDAEVHQFGDSPNNIPPTADTDEANFFVFPTIIALLVLVRRRR